MQGKIQPLHRMDLQPARRGRFKGSWKSPFEVGEKMKHAKFGVGVVIACNPLRDDVEVTVAFPGVVGVKKLVQKLAKLEKV